MQCLKSRDNEIKLAKHDMINWLACTYYKQYEDKNIIRKRSGVILDQICRFGCLGHFRLPQENFHKIMGQYFFWFHLNKSTIIICVRKRLKKKTKKKKCKKKLKGRYHDLHPFGYFRSDDVAHPLPPLRNEIDPTPM